MEQEIKTHDLKTWPEFFEEVAAGRKPFEVRHNDRNFQVGDILVLREFRPIPSHNGAGSYTGRRITAHIEYLTSFGQIDGNVVMGIRILESEVERTRVTQDSILADAVWKMGQHNEKLLKKIEELTNEKDTLEKEYQLIKAELGAEKENTPQPCQSLEAQLEAAIH